MKRCCVYASKRKKKVPMLACYPSQKTGKIIIVNEKFVCGGISILMICCARIHAELFYEKIFNAVFNNFHVA